MKSQLPPKLAAPGQTKQSHSSRGNQQSKVLLGVFILIFVLAGTATMLLAYYIYQPQIPALLQAPTRTPSPTSKPDCDKPSLTLGPYIYPLDKVSVSQDNTLPIIPGPADTAWWVSNTRKPFVFIFDPAVRSIDLKAVLVPGEQVTVQWADCSQEEFVYTDFDDGPPDSASLLAQTTTGIAIVVQAAGNRTGYVLFGQRPELIKPSAPGPTP